MPKLVKAASARAVGGKSKEYKPGDFTPTGRERSADPWSTVAAIAIQQQLVHNFRMAPPGTFKFQSQYTERVLSQPSELEIFLAGDALRTAPERDRKLASAIMHQYATRATKDNADINACARYVWARVRAHAGPAERITKIARVPAVPPLQDPGWWLDKSDCQYQWPRRPASQDGRLWKQIKSWGKGALAGYPDHAVICVERAAGRVRAWRKAKSGRKSKRPPAILIKALIHTKHLPTALANSGDHFFLPVLGRWVSPSEMLRLFRVPDDSSFARALLEGRVNLSAGGLISALGRSVVIDCATVALNLAASHLAGYDEIRFASSCSGIDAYATSVEAMFGAKMRYMHAAESRPSVAKALVAIFANKGLRRDMVLKDARVISNLVGPCDIWAFTPPCETYSKRNHSRSEAALTLAHKQTYEMLWYPRMWRPKIILAENVAENDAISINNAALLTLPGYDWITVPTEAQDFTDMARSRHMWVGIRCS